MKKSVWIPALLIAIPLLVLAQSHRAPYAGQQTRQIKALSAEEVQAYLQGRGIGFAKAAELNSYPGPMHVLELAAQLRLTEKQKSETQEVFERMRGDAIGLGKLIVEKEAELNRLFVRSEVNATNLQATVGEIARLQGELRIIHLRAHLEVKHLLSPAQVKKYDEMRGYGEGTHQHRQHDNSGD